jgi:hypothetical protein
MSGIKNVTFWAINSPLRPYETAGVHRQHAEKISAGKQQILGGICLALALAFGLGGKDAAAKYLEELKQKRSGR